MRDGGDRSDETDPFARLERTHRRIEERLAALEAGEADAADVIEWLDRSAARHHDDEERSLFPRLAADAAFATILAALGDEHRALDAATRALAASPADPTLAARLNDLYRAHIDREERELFPRARAALTAVVIEEIGREMIGRRRG
jgi:hemerythrin-like domain-containing protein